MKGKTYIITGANSGIGKAIALSLAKANSRVVMVCRDRMKGESALSDIRNESNNTSVELLIGDLGSIAGVKKLAQEAGRRCPEASVLINNAGVWPAKLVTNEDGLENAFMVNHLAPFILSCLLFPALRKNSPARIVNVNAGLYAMGKLDLDRTPYGGDFGRFATYMNTKLCNVLFTREFARRIEGSGVTMNALHPGVIRTNLGDTAGLAGSVLRLMKRTMASPESGAVAPVWLATASELEGVNGKFFNIKKEMPYAANACDDVKQKKLWRLSADLSGVDMPEGKM